MTACDTVIHIILKRLSIIYWGTREGPGLKVTQDTQNWQKAHRTRA